MKVVWSAESLEQLADIEHFIAQDNPKAARKQLKRLLDQGESLTDLAKRGRRVPEYPDDDFHELLESPYRIIYRIDTDSQQVFIYTVMHYRQVLPYRPDRRWH